MSTNQVNYPLHFPNTSVSFGPNQILGTSTFVCEGEWWGGGGGGLSVQWPQRVNIIIECSDWAV